MIEIRNIKSNKSDFSAYCRYITRLLDQEMVEPEFLLLKELADLKVEMAKINDLPKKEAQILYKIHEFLLSDAIIGKVARFKIWSYRKLLAI
ncbi:MAG: hypothetical protein WAT70_07815 [Rhizobiaceae bacterium]